MLNISIKNNSNCDECQKIIKATKNIFCEKCFNELLYENLELKEEIEELKQKLKRLERFDMCEY